MVAGKTWARVRNIINEAGLDIEAAGPGTPVEVDGWKDQPEAGDLAIQVQSEDKAKDVVAFRVAKAERLRQAADMEAINESRRVFREKEEHDKLMTTDPAAAATAAAAAAEVAKDSKSRCQEVSFIVKADVSGSVEAVLNAMASIGNDEVRAKIIRSAFGPVSEFDVDHASAAEGKSTMTSWSELQIANIFFEGIILAFNLPQDPLIANYARAKGVKIMQSSIIYALIDDVKAKLSEKLPPIITQRVTGEAEVLELFPYKFKDGLRVVAGCRVKLNSVVRNSRVRVRRKDTFVYDGWFIDQSPAFLLLAN